ncbi:MAG TPA: helix-turn-helix domain-containing protein [Solirubrobacteraceae bacterium]|jgi:AcrR family transcriptional regulator|nr:helix-turn-helix domain-containing protein [Solirubrobacteraceae bacterium]
MPTHASPAPPKHDGRSAELRGTARERILDAALVELHDRGYAGVSLQGVARRAGLTKGAVYWSFRDKQDLFLTLVHERVDVPARQLMRLTADAPSDVETAPLVSQGMAEIIRKQPSLPLLIFEHWSMAVRDPELRRGYVDRQSELRRAMARTLQTRHATTGVPLTYPAARLATGILCLAAGIAMEALVEPAAAPDELFGEILGLIYDGLAARAAKEAQP